MLIVADADGAEIVSEATPFQVEIAGIGDVGLLMWGPMSLCVMFPVVAVRLTAPSVSSRSSVGFRAA